MKVAANFCGWYARTIGTRQSDEFGISFADHVSHDYDARKTNEVRNK